MNIHDKFELSDGVTILACTGDDATVDIIGRKLSLIFGNEIRQTLTIVGERKMLNQKSDLDLKAFETNDIVSLSGKEAQSGEWKLINA